MSFNFTAAVTVCGDFGAQENKICHCFHFFFFYLPWNDATRCHDLSFLVLSFKPDFPGGSDSKESASNMGDPGSIPGSGISPGEGNATYSSILAWEIPWTEKPGRLQSMDCRVGHDWVTHTQVLSQAISWERLIGKDCFGFFFFFALVSNLHYNLILSKAPSHKFLSSLRNAWYKLQYMREKIFSLLFQK